MATKLIYGHFVKWDLKEINNWYSKIDKKLWTQFPFGIHYFYNKEKNLIEIYSVLHTSRNPEQWKERK